MKTKRYGIKMAKATAQKVDCGVAIMAALGLIVSVKNSLKINNQNKQLNLIRDGVETIKNAIVKNDDNK